MNLYIWKPQGHGQETVIVMEDSLKKARTAADKYVKIQVACGCDLYYRGWNTDYYDLKVYQQGEVVTHEND